MRYLILALTLFAMPALAVDITVTWEPPAERVDGTPITVDELSGYEAECSGNVVLDLADGAATEATIALDYGRYDCRMRVYDTEGLVSDWSTVVSVVVNASPNSPRIIDFGRL